MKKRFPWETYDVIFYSEETALNSSPLVKEIGFWVKHFYRRNVRPQGPHQNSLPRLKTDNSFSSPQSCGKLETPPHPFPELQGLGLWSSHSCHLCHCEWNRLACWVLNLVSFTWFNAPKIHLPIPVPCWLGVIWMDKHLLSNKRSRAGGSTHHLDCSGSCSQVSALVTSHAASGMWLTRCCWGGLKFQTN